MAFNWDDWSWDTEEQFGGYDSQEEYDYWETDNGEFDQGYFEDNFLWADGIDDYTYEDTSWGWDQEPTWTSKENNQSVLGSYGSAGSFLGGLLGGKDGSIDGRDLMGIAGGLGGSYLKDRDNKRYNEMMQPLTDLYKAQAADVAKRRANRDANIAREYDTAINRYQPDWDRRDQIADNLRQAQGTYQSSSAAWDRAANEQRRDATKLATEQSIANRYDERTGLLGGQLRGLNPWNEKYGQAQQNPYLNMGLRGMMGV